MLTTFGSFVLFLRGMVTRTERFRVLWNRTIDEAILIGVDSVFIVSIVSAFIGAVTCVQIAYNLTNPLIPQSTIGYMVREMTILELAPTITSIVLAGKVGSSIAGGLGTMRITEQISALEVMGINSTSYLVLPRILAALLMFPMLVIMAMLLSIMGGYLAGTLTGVMTAQDYIEGIRTDFIPYNIVFALIKAVVFAFLVSGISSFKGYFTTGGALEVGAASTGAVTNSIIAILIADFALAAILL
ncbi:MlaE family ABC transporter permease [Hymenobacter properus]|uniref:ABC transporter permease n=1 Tax=Hymenobacter properus TaxID=2791026 RepID=A0A931FL91_9BACT|nr:ABC transporter permease [Hymenobacter properus]MBF9143923.1 ABC transporter permease [Hymenobacter properus]MBR7722737.1 ABC transporter permease [Microvirga sp. SRT04]